MFMSSWGISAQNHTPIPLNGFSSHLFAHIFPCSVSSYHEKCCYLSLGTQQHILLICLSLNHANSSIFCDKRIQNKGRYVQIEGWKSHLRGWEYGFVPKFPKKFIHSVCTGGLKWSTWSKFADFSSNRQSVKSTKTLPVILLHNLLPLVIKIGFPTQNVVKILFIIFLFSG